MIYFAVCREATAVKIGVCRDHPTYVHHRVSMMQTGCPLRIELVGVLDGSYPEERDLLEQFASARIHGEWFHLTSELQDKLLTLNPPPAQRPKLKRGGPPRQWFTPAERMSA